MCLLNGHWNLWNCCSFSCRTNDRREDLSLSLSQLSNRHIEANFCVPIRGKIWKKMVCCIGCNTIASRCISRFLYEQGLLATPMYHEMGKMKRLALHTLCYICRVGDKVVSVEVQTTSVMKKNLRMRMSKIHTQRESERDRHKKALYFSILTVTITTTNNLN